MAASDRLRVSMVGFTLIWVAGYAPLETYVTYSLAGVSGFAYQAYIMNVVGMALMLWGGLATKRARPHGPAVMAVGWAWTTATFWRATADRFLFASLGHEMYAGPAELWLAPALTVIACAAMIASLVLVVRPPR